MKISDIEAIQIYPRIAARNADRKVNFQRTNHRAVFKVKADNGIVGYGETRYDAPPRSSFEYLIGRSPFDFINANLNTGLMGALYDAMGKHLEMPAHMLMGQKVRDRVPVAAWTRPASPEDLASEVQRAVAEGYMIFKMHTCEHYDVLEQNRAVEEVAPEGFRMHYDFNHNRPSMAVLRLIQELEKSPVVGIIEDPLVWRDIDGWRRLREKTSLPLLMHGPQLGAGPEIIQGCADAYMVGESGIGNSIARGFACGAANLSTVIQLTGGTLTKAMAMHMGAVLPIVSHSINLDDQYEEDVTVARIPVVEGCSPVPEGPGLGVEVDEEALAGAEANRPTVPPRHVGVLHLPGGHRLYTRSYPSISRQTGFAEGAIRGLRFEIREDDGSPEFAQIYERIQQEGSVLE